MSTLDQLNITELLEKFSEAIPKKLDGCSIEYMIWDVAVHLLNYSDRESKINYMKKRICEAKECRH